MGRPAFQPTEQQRHLVQVLRANGVKVEMIAANLRIDLHTLHKHFRHELAAGKAQVDAALGTTIIRAGLNGDWRAALQWLARFSSDDRWRLPRGDADPALSAEADGEPTVHIYTPERRSG